MAWSSHWGERTDTVAGSQPWGSCRRLASMNQSSRPSAYSRALLNGNGAISISWPRTFNSHATISGAGSHRASHCDAPKLAVRFSSLSCAAIPAYCNPQASTGLFGASGRLRQHSSTGLSRDSCQLKPDCVAMTCQRAHSSTLCSLESQAMVAPGCSCPRSQLNRLLSSSIKVSN
ncbi:hypothetical protein D9M71_272390 [compost metagenome]